MKGDRAAADTLIRRYYDEIYRYAFRQSGKQEEASDLTQDIFVSMLGAITSFDGKQARFRTWLYKIVTKRGKR
jgi:RNA polymerase sigma-70 factor (ECF subfamily)